MSRVDVPTLMCDRCGLKTQDLAEMAKFDKVEHHHMSGRDEWDLCPICYAKLRSFMAGKELETS